jgi:hypothetical protein
VAGRHQRLATTCDTNIATTGSGRHARGNRYKCPKPRPQKIAMWITGSP